MINCVINAPLMLISIIGNALVLVALLRTPPLRSPFTVFLCSLAVSDLLVGLLVQPIYIAHELKPGPLLLISVHMLFNTGCVVSLCTMTAISVDRFLALHYHMRYSNFVTEKRATHASVMIWLITILASCLSLWHNSHAVLAVGIVVCLLISAFSYIRIYLIARHHQLQINAQQQAMQSTNTDQINVNMARSKTSRSAVNTFIYYICMILCYLPMFISMTIYVIDPTLSSKKWTFANTVVFMNSSLNPILYCWRLCELRVAVRTTVQQLLCKQTGQN